jgi:hypothetical protein
MAPGMDRPEENLTLAEFRELFESVSSWGRWGADDQRGALNYLNPGSVRAAAGLVRSGETVSLSLPLNTTFGVDNPAPVDHHMTLLADDGTESGPLQFAKDYIGADYHNPSHSHIDAFCHVSFDGRLYNGRPSSSVTSRGATEDAIDVLRGGLIGRGVLLDLHRVRPSRSTFRSTPSPSTPWASTCSTTSGSRIWVPPATARDGGSSCSPRRPSVSSGEQAHP